MNNIRFSYLYRDGSNYKSWGDIVFSNPEYLAVTEIETELLNAFLPDKRFIANQIDIPEKFLFMDANFTRYDHCYHEFDCIEVCEDSVTDFLGRSITNFLQDIKTASKQGWKAFDILDKA